MSQLRPSEASRRSPIQTAQELWNRLGVRARVTVLFGLGALLLSLIMGIVSYVTVRQFLVSDQENAAKHQAFSDAALVVRAGLTNAPGRADACAEALKTVSGSNSVLYCDHQWFATLIGGKNSLPPALRAMVLSGSAGLQNTLAAGSPVVAVGVPVPSLQIGYFQVTSLADLAHTLRILSYTLVSVGFVTTILGAAVGRSASARSLRPVAAVSRAAVAIAGGRLDTRLEAGTTDPDLAGLTTSFNRMVDQLQERIEREARFSSDVSHELRSPLTTLAASLEVLESDTDAFPPRTQRALALLGADVRRFQRMVADLLEISRFDTGSADLVLEEVDPAELVRRAVAVQAGGHSDVPPPTVRIGPGVDGVRLAVDKRRFGRVMANLLENAALYGGGANTVDVSLAPVGTGQPRAVLVAVCDGGPGVPEAERAKVFERFYRGQASGRRGAGTGTGLGLSLVAEHVRLLGGQVWVQTAPGGGACFVVELPADTEAAT